MLAMYAGDICLRSRLERVFPKKYSFGLSVTKEFPLPRGVREELILKVSCLLCLLFHNVIFTLCELFPKILEMNQSTV